MASPFYECTCQDPKKKFGPLADYITAHGHNLPDFVIGQIAESCAEMPGLNSLDFRRFISVLAQRRSQSLQEFKKKFVLVEVRLS